MSSEIEALRAQLAAAQLREQASAQREQASVQREQALAQINQEYERTTRRTTIVELLEACHTLLYTKLHVVMDKVRTTRGSITNPTGKHCPRFLKKWTEFPELHSETWDSIFSTLNQDRKFPNLNYIENLTDYLRSTIASEDDLKDFQHRAVEDFASAILGALGHNVSFRNQSHSLAEGAEEVQERGTNPSDPLPSVPEPRNADQICIYKNDDDRNEPLIIIEYKAPHKLTQAILRLGLETTELDVCAIRDEAEMFKGKKKTKYEARWLAAAAASQTYDYMLKSGAVYGCIVTGESIVFLWLDIDTPDTLYYHLALPKLEAYSDKSSTTFLHPYTAVGYLATFCQMALHVEPRGEDWRIATMEQSEVWIIDMEKRLLQMEKDVQEELRTSPKHSPFYGRLGPLLRSSPAYTRSRGLVAKLAQPGCKPAHETASNDDDDSFGGPSSRPYQGAYTPTKTGAARQAERRERESKVTSSKGQQQRPYCTQTCLLGIARRSSIDQKCPNAALHPRSPRKQGSVHLLTKQMFCELVRLQLATTMDKDIKDLHLQGARSMVFYITLATYGYTFIGKGTIDVFIPDLMHEASMYRRLRTLQGRSIPVHLGNIDLVYPWYEFDVTVIHMLLISYGGRSLTEEEYSHDLSSQVTAIEMDLLRLGIRHEDLRPANLLWSEELKRVLLIDFERSRIRSPAERRLVGIKAKAERQDSTMESRTVSDEQVMLRDFLWEGTEDLVLPNPSPEKELSPVKKTITSTAGNPTMKMQTARGKENEIPGDGLLALPSTKELQSLEKKKVVILGERKSNIN
ncbi:MAG: hypothetical protein LQ341_006032 [Variospora aurantia]|nr:MAG: hypothetical protein LQ341_006032 [Variospora aurantia]